MYGEQFEALLSNGEKGQHSQFTMSMSEVLVNTLFVAFKRNTVIDLLKNKTNFTS